MKYKNNSLKQVLCISFLSTLFLFTGCSQKNVDADYMKFYKDTKNPRINNSKEMHKYTMRPYTVFGVKYYPFIPKIGDDFDGTASWYGPDFHSKKTSNGEVYDMYDMTAAHKTLPMNTVVRVDNLENGKSIVVRINDRGPFVNGRIIDLSNKAARDIDMIRKGTANVKITVLGFNGEIENNDAPHDVVQKRVTSDVKGENLDVLEPLDIKEDKISSTTAPTISKATTKVERTTPLSKTTVTKAPVLNNNIDTKVSKPVLSTGKYSIQIGAFSKLDGATKTKNDYQRRFSSNKVDLERTMVDGKEIYKVFVKGFSSQEEASRFKNINSLSNSIIINK